ncbi:MAG: indole-3-glycerol-phosphate synthase [Actinobacteria bacterium]|nr:indole-3-glycerol-phosphate synthase [Actinomycetota bacterium]
MFLDEAVRESKREAERREAERPPGLLEKIIEELPASPGFKEAVTRAHGRPRLIAEIKRNSPSLGSINPGVDVIDQVRAYREGGASALSVLTCGFKFGGSIDDLEAASRTELLPVLRKDFISTAYQVVEARAFGASAVLLIAAALTERNAGVLMGHAKELGLDVLFEVHGEKDIGIALNAGAQIIGINNRDLNTLEVDLGATEKLIGRLPDSVVKISESGIRDRADVERMEQLGVDALLVGGALMSTPDPAEAIKELMGHDAAGGDPCVG